MFSATRPGPGQVPAHASIHGRFEEQAARTPTGVALSGLGKVTYQELNAQADALAQRLRDSAVPAGALVAIYAARSPGMIAGLLATLKLGAAYVGLDLESPPARLADVLAEARPAVILTQRALAARLPPVGDETQIVFIDDAPPSDPGPPSPAGTVAGGHDDAESLAYVSFTSGTTGRPKGVCIPHRGVLRLVREPDYVQVTPDDVFLQFAPLAFDASTFEIWGALLNGARLAICPDRKPSLPELASFIEREGVSILWLTAGLFHQMADANLLGHLRGVRQLLAGGDVLSVPHVAEVLRALPGTRLINGYGPTENTTFTCCHPVRTCPPPGQSVPIGKPINGTYCRVLDERGQSLPDGEAGELYVGGTGLAHGYLRQPQLTASQFVPDPFSPDPAARLYRTGDRVRRRPDGDLEFLGRADRQVKIRGHRVELDEVEATLNEFPGLRAVAVALQRGPAGEERLVAGVVLAVAPPAPEAAAPTAADLRAWTQRRLPSYMVPGRFVFLDALPLNASGKVDRQALLELGLASPARHAGNVPAAAADTAPRDATEAALVTVWREVLGLPEVDRNDDFFDCGGDSLRASHLLARVQAVLGRPVPFDVLLARPTVARLAEFIAGQTPTAVSAVQVLRAGGEKPPLYFVPSQGGDLMCYAALARHFSPGERPLLGLQERTLLSAEAEEGGTSIEAVAAAHVQTLRERQPAGPYHLVGFCFGGLVAFEMARQLRATKSPVGWLGVLDYRFKPTADARGGQLWNTVRAPGAFARNLGCAVGDLLTLPAPERRVLGRKLARWRPGRGTSSQPTTGRIPIEGVTADLSHYTARQLRLLEMHELAWRRYAPPPGNMAMTMFRPNRLPLWRAWDTTLGWDRVAGAGLRVRTVPGPGAHGAVLKEPFARELARQIERALHDET